MSDYNWPALMQGRIWYIPEEDEQPEPWAHPATMIGRRNP